MHILKCVFSSTKSYPPFSVEVGIMFFVYLLFFLIVYNWYSEYRLFHSDTHHVYVWDKRRIYLYPLFVLVKVVPKFNVIGRVCFCNYISQYPFSAYASEGKQFTKVYNFLLNAFCIN